MFRGTSCHRVSDVTRGLPPEDTCRIRVHLGDQILKPFGRGEIIIDVPTVIPVSAVERPLAPLGVVAELGHRQASPLFVRADGDEA